MYSELEYSSQLSAYYLPIFTTWSKADTQAYPQKMNRLDRSPLFKGNLGVSISFDKIRWDSIIVKVLP